MQDNPRDAGLERRLEAWAASRSDSELHPEVQRMVTGLLASSLTPVRPLPSQSRLVLTFLVVFAACAAGVIAVMDKAGFHLMTVVQMACMAAILAAGEFSFRLQSRGEWSQAADSPSRFRLCWRCPVSE